MFVVIVIAAVVLIVVVDLAMRTVLGRLAQTRRRRQRQEALDLGLKLTISDDTPSLTRVEVADPKARILAIDDERIVLDSFRKTLVLEGFAVDTVETGAEGLNLLAKREYDFVFTDLKMPDMDGLDVTKAVKHVRPDVDVILITGHATVESAVDAMKYGALDYVQKPFSADELVDFVSKSLFRRQDRIEKQQTPQIHLVTVASSEQESNRVFNVPAGVFVSSSHAWAKIEVTGEVRIGLDDLVRKTLGEIDAIILPKVGSTLSIGGRLFTVKRGEHSIAFPSPVAGRVTRVNDDLEDRVELLRINPLGVGWICKVHPNNITADLSSLRIGADAISWYESEAKKVVEMHARIHRGEDHNGTAEVRQATSTIDAAAADAIWKAFPGVFLQTTP